MYCVAQSTWGYAQIEIHFISMINTGTKTITKEIILTFLKDVYFSEWREPEQAYIAAGNRAYRDFCRTIRGMKDDAEDKDECKDTLSKAIFTSLEKANPQSQEAFDKWHHKTCEEIIEKYRGTALLNYGQAQKWVNMALKYGIVLEIPQAEAAIPYAHVPVDNIVIKMLSKENVHPSSSQAWSKWDKDIYVDFQSKIRQFAQSIGKYPIVWEFTNWQS